MKTLEHAIVKMLNLECLHLGLWKNSIGIEGCKMIANGISNCPKMSEINLSLGYSLKFLC